MLVISAQTLCLVSFSTSDPLKVQLAKLYAAMSQVTKVPLAISFHQTRHEARNAIKNFCALCFGAAHNKK